MDPVVATALLWVLFIGTHLGMSTTPVRSALIERLGKPAFIAVYSVVASVCFIWLTHYYAVHRFEGPAGLDLSGVPVVRELLIGLIVLGLALVAGAFSPKAYRMSPMSPLNDKVREAYGLERITRHPFFIGLGLTFGAHALLSAKLVGFVYFAGYVVLPLAGGAHLPPP